jgi:hypothetical protein
MIWAILASSTVALQAHAPAASGRSMMTIIGTVTFRDRERNGTILCTQKIRDQRYMEGSAARFIALAGVGIPGTPKIEQFYQAISSRTLTRCFCFPPWLALQGGMKVEQAEKYPMESKRICLMLQC